MPRTTTTTANTVINPHDFIRASEAAKILGVPRERISALATRGWIGVYRLPGVQPRYCRADVERLATRAVVKPATVAV